MKTGDRLLTLKSHTDGVTCLQFNDEVIVSGSYDKTVKLWDFSVCWMFVTSLFCHATEVHTVLLFSDRMVALGLCTIILIIGPQQAVTGNVRLRPFLCLLFLFLFFSLFCLFPSSLFHTQVGALSGIWGEVVEPVCMPLRMNTAMKKPFVPFFGPALKHLSPAMCIC